MADNDVKMADKDVKMVDNGCDSDELINPRITWDGCSVLLDVNDGDRLIFARLAGAAKLKIGSANVPLKSLIGCPFGSSFEVVTGTDGPTFSRLSEVSELKETADCDGESRDNRSINDDNKAQILSAEEIDAMKKQGAKADEIIDALIANSATFDKKTAFSQEKYRIKKQKKYAPKAKLRRPSSRIICEAYFKKYPHRIGFLRFDALSLLLTMGNVGPNGDVLVVDRVGGMLTGSVAERLGGSGHVCNAYVGRPSIEIVKIFNFNSETRKRILCMPLKELCTSEPVLPQIDSICSSSVDENVSPIERKNKGPKAGERASLETLNFWKEHGFSSLIMAACEMDPWCLIKDIMPLLAFSAPFAIYGQYLQPLASCMRNMQSTKMAVGLQISEPWLREYQVLPSRTHPMMQMSSFGGYILSGTSTFSS